MRNIFYEKTGIKNFLIGESLLKSDKPGELMKKLFQINNEIKAFLKL